MKCEKELAINAIYSTAKLFYQQNIKEGYSKLEYTIDVLSKIIDAINIDEEEGKQLIKNSFNNILKEALQAMEQGDTILLSDILQYDLKELIEQVL